MALNLRAELSFSGLSFVANFFAAAERHEQRRISQFESDLYPTIDSVIFSFLN